MRETKQDRNARLLKTLSASHISGEVAWNMVRELKAADVALYVNDMLIQPQRQDLMWNLKRSPESCWFATKGGITSLILTPAIYEEADFKKWSDVVEAAKPKKPVFKTELELDAMAEEMLDDMTHEDMVNWALSKNLDFEPADGRTEQTVQIIMAVGTAGWAQHFDVQVREEE